MKKLFKLTESDLRNIIKESVNKIINEIGDTPNGQRALGAVAARSIHRHYDALGDDDPESAEYWDNVANDAARIGHNNVQPGWEDLPNGEAQYFDDGMEYWENNLKKYESKNIDKKLFKLTERDLHSIVKESVNKVLKEGQEGYNQVMGVLNKPIWQEKLKKAWEKEKLTNPNPDWDSFEYNFAIRCLDKEREKDAKHYYKMRKYQHQLDNNTRKYV